MTSKTITPRAELSADQQTSLRPYHSGITDQGEPVNPYKYLAGEPKQYRFNGQVGQFFLGADRPIGNTFTFQPIAWRLFEENLFGRGRKDEWAELFFIDDKNCVSSIMFNNTSVGGLRDLIRDLFYEELSLIDVVLTIKPEKKENDKGKWNIATFSYVLADPQQVEALKAYAHDFRIFRADTLTKTTVYSILSDTYYLPEPFRATYLDAESADVHIALPIAPNDGQ